MTINFQDDARESSMRDLFELQKDELEGRSGIDAFLLLDGERIPFELKTTSKGSVTTVRDFGPDHIQKWQDKHWLIGFFLKGTEYYKYASPSQMKPWIQKKEQYILPDFKLANLLPNKIDLEDLYEILGVKSIYSLADAKYLQKNQYKKEKYLELQDMESGYSAHRMLDILRDRARYLLERGSTLNNPHIPLSHFNECPEITQDHAQQLRLLVREYFLESA